MADCPVCGGVTCPCGSIDFNKTCEDHKDGRVFSAPGDPIAYRRCTECGTAFAPSMCAWPAETFKDRVYNDGYALADPDYEITRPVQNAAWLAQNFKTRAITHLDYGGGNGALSRAMERSGYRSQSWDPFHGDPEPKGEFDLVTAFEVMEHVPDPQALKADLLRYLRHNGMLVFSTLTSDGIADLMGWWYAAPRNGHVCLYTKRALKRLFAPMKLLHLSSGMHVAFHTLPPWVSFS